MPEDFSIKNGISTGERFGICPGHRVPNLSESINISEDAFSFLKMLLIGGGILLNSHGISRVKIKSIVKFLKNYNKIEYVEESKLIDSLIKQISLWERQYSNIFIFGL